MCTSKNKIYDRKEKTSIWFQSLRDKICNNFEEIEKKLTNFENINIKPSKFKSTKWKREGGGGGEISIMKGCVFEKVGVNISTVHGKFSDQFKKQIPGAEEDGKFWASGISVVAHPMNPHVPAAHMNTRYICTSKTWFGGGCDLTPVFFDKNEKYLFHNALEKSCDKYDKNYYKKFKKWCEEYFYIKHRDEQRGIGGIFFDYLKSSSFENDFNFTKEIGSIFNDVYSQIILKKINKKWTTDHKNQQLFKRGRYVEFNLMYDRGTQFGIKTGGNIDAILMSLPPTAKW